jgi:hypothetical protein
LPGLNLVYGLPGETHRTHAANLTWLAKVFETGMLCHRTNVRQARAFPGTPLAAIQQQEPPPSAEHFPTWKADAPVLGITLPSGPIAHERMRQLLQDCVAHRTDDYLGLAEQHAVTIPAGAAPTWWTHLVLIYFKRLFLNRPSRRLCAQRPVCGQAVDCPHSGS